MKTTFWVNHPTGFYFRLWGFGFAVERDMPVLFSERYGHRKVWRQGRWAFQWLTRSGLPHASAPPEWDGSYVDDATGRPHVMKPWKGESRG